MTYRIPSELEPYVIRKSDNEFEAKSNMPQKMIMKFKEFQAEAKGASLQYLKKD